MYRLMKIGNKFRFSKYHAFKRAYSVEGTKEQIIEVIKNENVKDINSSFALLELDPTCKHYFDQNGRRLDSRNYVKTPSAMIH